MNVQQMSDPRLSAWIAEHIMHIPRERIFDTALGLEMVSTQIEEYATDRNACAEMEAEIARRGLQDAYVLALYTIVQPEYDHVDSPSLRGLWQFITATPRQRCEAAYVALGGSNDE